MGQQLCQASDRRLEPVQAVLVSGIPGSGKTTVSRQLAARMDKAAHIEGDILSFEFVVSGLPMPDHQPEWGRLMDLRRRQICFLADSYAEAGFIPVIDDVVANPDTLRLYQRYLRLRPLRLVVLAPLVDVVRVRDAERDKQVFETWAHLDEEIRSTLKDRGLWLDSSFLTPAQTVDEIIARLDEATVLP